MLTLAVLILKLSVVEKNLSISMRNSSGLNKEDLRLTLEKHATSKIVTL